MAENCAGALRSHWWIFIVPVYCHKTAMPAAVNYAPQVCNFDSKNFMEGDRLRWAVTPSLGLKTAHQFLSA
ncbi:hypothetical protein [Nostoc sp.]|uniref:hypothetical protein n=1 Tax=Nostoc sp. TaxID=1180 RepID=UPI002FF63935